MPFFETALQAIRPQVDKVIILYTNTPSQGHQTSLTCPDSRDDLKAIADKYDCEWVDGRWQYEGEHCDAINQYTKGYDWLIRFDADEIYPQGAVDMWISQAEKTNAKTFRAPFYHFWRSFSRVCIDGQMPDRITRINGGEGFAYLDETNQKVRIYHFGYAQPTKYIQYKMQVSGHKAEWRGDWFNRKWCENAQTDIHPVVFNFWNAQDFNKDIMPDQLRQHSYYSQKII